MFVTQEEVLNGDSRRLSGVDGNFNAFFGFNRLMNALAPFSTF